MKDSGDSSSVMKKSLPDFRVSKADDLVTVQPFEGAANKTAAIFVTKGEKTVYPVPYIVWKRVKGVGKIPTDAALVNVLPLLEKKKLQAKPIGKLTGSWQTIDKKKIGLEKIEGENAYKARRGASTEPYGVFWLSIKQVFSDGSLLVTNLVEKGKRNIQQVEEVVESDLVFPGVRGADIARWNTNPRIHVTS